MADVWNVLIVDDERDVHAISRLALSRFEWKGKKVKITSVYSGAEARTALTSPDSPVFEVAVVDVVMETNDAGLRLCEFIRQLPSRVTRIIVRTGQPGIWPEEKVLKDYAIDCYLSKGAATQGELGTAIRTCLQASEDIRAVTVEAPAGGVAFIIDPDAANLDALHRALSRTCDVQTFKDSREALEAARANPPDLILLDFRTPGLGGTEFLDELRDSDVESAVIFLTGQPYEPDVEKAVASERVFWTVAKPFDPDSLRGQVGKVLSLVRFMKRNTKSRAL